MLKPFESTYLPLRVTVRAQPATPLTATTRQEHDVEERGSEVSFRYYDSVRHFRRSRK
jgi:hypothetical protein